MLDQLPNECFRRRGGEIAVKMNDQQMLHAEIANERNFVLRRREQVRRILRSQNLRRVRIKGNNNRHSAGVLSVSRRSGNDCLMTEVHAIENTDGQK